MKLLQRYINKFSTSVLLVAVILSVVTYGCGTPGGEKAKNNTAPENKWIEGMRSRISKHIEAPDTQGAMLLIVDHTERDLADLNQVLQKFYKNMAALNNDYAASPDEYRNAITTFEIDRKKVADRIKASRFQLKELATPEEWKALTAFRESKGLYKHSIIQSIE